MSGENDMKKIEEMGKIIKRLHQLNNADWLYVSGTVNALIFAQNQNKEKQKDQKKIKVDENKVS